MGHELPLSISVYHLKRFFFFLKNCHKNYKVFKLLYCKKKKNSNGYLKASSEDRKTEKDVLCNNIKGHDIIKFVLKLLICYN